MVVLARAREPWPLNRIIRHMGVSRPYVQSMLDELLKAGLVEKEARFRAGYSLGRCAEEITLKEITDTVDSSLYAVNSKSRKSLSGEFYELLLWKSFCREIVGARTVADILAMARD